MKQRDHKKIGFCNFIQNNVKKKNLPLHWMVKTKPTMSI